jgi:hypothetical protein
MNDPIQLSEAALAGPHFLVFKYNVGTPAGLRWAVGAVPAQTARILMGGEETKILDAFHQGVIDTYIVDVNDAVELIPAAGVLYRLYQLRQQLVDEGTLAGKPQPPPPPKGPQLPAGGGQPPIQMLPRGPSPGPSKK